MRTIILLASLLLVTAIAVTAQNAPPARPAAPGPALVRLPVEVPDNPTAGARLFVEKNCVQCHALGTGESRVGPDLGRISFPGTVLDLAGSFWNHSAVMREKMRDLRIAVPTLDSREMADLLAFLSAYRYYVAEVGEPPSAARGRQIFDDRKCGSCHGTPADFRKAGPSLDRYRGNFSAIYIAQSMWNRGAEMAQVMDAKRIPWPRFQGTEMGDLLAYLQTGSTATSAERVYYEPGSPRRGAELFASKRCRDCHAIGGVGGRVGPDLGARGREFIGPIASIVGLMWNHSHGMTAQFQRRGIPRVTFSGQEMADIVSYLYFVNYATVYGAPSRGQKLFDGMCSACHTLGRGKSVGPDLATVPNLDDPTAIVATMWNHAAAMEETLRRLGMVWPLFAPGEAADLSAYILISRGWVPPPASRSGTAAIK